MKIAFAINALAAERTDYTTTHLAMHAILKGHEVCYVEVDRFELGDDNRLSAHGRRVPEYCHESRAMLMSALRQAPVERLDIGALDVLFLRSDPASEALVRPWAQLAGVNFGRLAMQAGVLVVNSPEGLYHAVNKLYLQLFPKDIRPRTLISRDFDAVRGFLHDVGGKAVVKPLRGSGGHNVFLIREDDTHNLRQIFEAICHEGYLIAQEYLPEAEGGDTRVFLLEGDLLEVEGEVAAVHRVPAAGDLRSNLMAGGRVRKAVITDRIREIAEQARSQLEADDMFFVGLDVIGDRVVEINVFSPGALIATQHVTHVDFGPRVIEALERKLEKHRVMSRQPWV
jgi:glutathione synthase